MNNVLIENGYGFWFHVPGSCSKFQVPCSGFHVPAPDTQHQKLYTRHSALSTLALCTLALSTQHTALTLYSIARILSFGYLTVYLKFSFFS